MKMTVDKVLFKAKSLQNKGELEEARLLYLAVLKKFPKNKRIQQALASLTEHQSVNTPSSIDPPKEEMDGLVTLYNARRLAELCERAEKLVTEFSDSSVLLNIFGLARTDLGEFETAEVIFRRALEINPKFPAAHNNLGNALKGQGRLDEAIAAYKQALAFKPDYTSAYSNMGVTLQEQGKLDEAIIAYQQALRFEPNNASAHNNMGNALQAQGKLDEAIDAYKRALALQPDFVSAYSNMGLMLQRQGRLDEAIAAYKQALALKPDYVPAYFNLGNTLKELGKLDEAIAIYERALVLKPDDAAIHNNMGSTIQSQGKLDEAIAAYERAVSIDPDFAMAKATMLHQMAHICDWSKRSKFETEAINLGLTSMVTPFCMLSVEDHPEHQLIRSQNYATETYGVTPLSTHAKPKARPVRLRVGYFSADFHEHATLYLMAGLLRNHDPKQFEIFAYSYGSRKSGEMRMQAKGDVDKFRDVTQHTNEEIRKLALSDKLDIAIDLKGYTTETRSDVFQKRLAPVQINYLGYPGSMGVDFMDYIIADPVVIPPEERSSYSEKVIYLPHSYQPNDNEREIAKITATRASFGLPEESFVFCCFNNNYKISPREFDIWMSLLTRVENSVLWLLKSNKWAEQNLRAEAEKRHVDPTRIVFAEKVPHAEHLARQKYADLFIDTFNYNAHTTASDAMWGGLPVVTKLGRQFAARVGASLLYAVGLPELITETEEEYEALILRLATQPGLLSEIRGKLEENRLSMPLFDTERYTRNFENGLLCAYDKFYNGEESSDIWVREN